MKRSITDFLKDAAVPPVCTVCGNISTDYLCPECLSGIKRIGRHRCEYCGRPLSYSDTGRCGACRDGDYHFTAHRSYTLYSGNMKKVIKKFKYNKIYGLKHILSGFLSDLYVRDFSGKDIDYVDTVPGEHMDLLAGIFSRQQRIPFIANILRIRKAQHQDGLGLEERMINVLDCFKLRDCLAFCNKNILLIDDVWTTGSTVSEVIRVVRSSGCRNIFLLTLARGA